MVYMQDGVRPVNVRVPNDLYADIESLAERDTRSVTQQVLHMLKRARDFDNERESIMRRLDILEVRIEDCQRAVGAGQKGEAKEAVV